MKEFGLQLYTLRDHFTDEKQTVQTLEKVAAAGYKSVQLFGRIDTAERIGSAAKALGLRVVGSTGSYKDFIGCPDEMIRVHKKLGAVDVGIGKYALTDVDGIREFIRWANDIAKRFSDNGLRLSYHNHHHEFIRIDADKTMYDYLIDGLSPDIGFVADTYWMQYGGVDVRRMIERLGQRISILHLKDMKSTADGPRFAEIGQGNLCWNDIIPLAERCSVNEFVVEQDECDGDPFESIQISAGYLRKNFTEKGEH